MSNELDVKVEEGVEEYTDGLREDNFKVTEIPSKHSFVKPTIHVEGAELDSLTPTQVVQLSKLIQEQTIKAMREANYNPQAAAQVLTKDHAPIVDFSKLTIADVYDMSIPIEAQAFMSADVLKIVLKDSNYEARWVNKNPQRLGEMIGKGFTFITASDLNNDGIQTGLDAEGHYCFNDVVAMKIDKATYFKALRAAHERALSTTNQSKIREKAAASANQFMRKSEVGNDFAEAFNSKKMEFYDPGIGI
jgi:hypothetical protein